MRIGPLRHRITIQSATLAQDSYGEPIKTWANLATNPQAWAEVTSAPAGERFLSGGEQVIAHLTHRVRIRYRSDVTVKMRVVHESRHLYIENVVDPTGRRRELMLLCREEQS